MTDVFDTEDTIGHRQRLKQRLLLADEHNLHDYELIELALFYALPRRDVKPLAKRLLRKFGSLDALLHASPDMLHTEVAGESVPTLFRLLVQITQRLANGRLKKAGPLMVDNAALRAYVQTVMSPLMHEQFRVFWLDTRGCLLCDEVHQQGTLNHAAVYPREMVMRGLSVGAAGVILAHNHPSGDPTPSRSDIQLTKSLVQAFNTVDIRVFDHVVVGHGKLVSFLELGLLQ